MLLTITCSYEMCLTLDPTSVLLILVLGQQLHQAPMLVLVRTQVHKDFPSIKEREHTQQDGKWC